MALCQNSTEENKRRYESMKNKARAMREKAEDVLAELQNCRYGMFRLAKGLKIDSIEVEGGRCTRVSDGMLCFSENERGKVWTDYM